MSEDKDESQSNLALQVGLPASLLIASIIIPLNITLAILLIVANAILSWKLNLRDFNGGSLTKLFITVIVPIGLLIYMLRSYLALTAS